MMINKLEDRISRTDERIHRAQASTATHDPKLGLFLRSGLKKFRQQRLEDLRKLMRQRPK